MSEVVVFTKPGCQPCKATIRRFTEAGIHPREFPAEQYRELIQALGYMQAPVVLTGVSHWSGYDPDRIDQAINQRRNT